MSATDAMHVVVIPPNSGGVELDTNIFQQLFTGYFKSVDYGLAGPIVADVANPLWLDVVVQAAVGGLSVFRKIIDYPVDGGTISMMDAVAISGFGFVVPVGQALGADWGWSPPTADQEHYFASTPNGTTSDPGGTLVVQFHSNR